MERPTCGNCKYWDAGKLYGWWCGRARCLNSHLQAECQTCLSDPIATTRIFGCNQWEPKS